ncbi:chymotrypsin-like elastase family member 1 [Plakobranchus ocellatus]|uniref:Chymotrypsin-like elastase family member 1 n=1 Tax=Plakobranchus ocellatus TaxID=259542 RepID=A0AAV3Z692_9GAST|nr:chymotrypsin-like elastase family member 1 [Plakobranchus ocellatus]
MRRSRRRRRRRRGIREYDKGDNADSKLSYHLPPPHSERCGVISSPYIVGGRRSHLGRWPWQVSLQIIASILPWHRCGGVLVHPSWVLTAAHCMEGPFYGNTANWRVVMADYDLDTVSGREVYRKIVSIVSHPGYIRTSNFPNDLALLELDSPVDVASGDVGLACLPDTNFDLSPGSNCWISGWGETRGSDAQEGQMNELSLTIMDTGQCKAMWDRVDISVLDTQICVGQGITGACYGDSGGPLMCERQGRVYVAGVMSWLVKNCSGPNFPNVFTRLPAYVNWVQERLDLYQSPQETFH